MPEDHKMLRRGQYNDSQCLFWFRTSCFLFFDDDDDDDDNLFISERFEIIENSK